MPPVRLTQSQLANLAPGTNAAAGAGRRKKGKAPAPSEKQIQASILQWLAFVHIFAWRNMTGGAMLKGGHFRRFGIVGGSDILGAAPDGRLLAIEVKKPGGKPPTPKQLEFLSRVNASGGLGFVARSIEDVQSKLKAEGYDL